MAKLPKASLLLLLAGLWSICSAQNNVLSIAPPDKVTAKAGTTASAKIVAQLRSICRAFSLIVPAWSGSYLCSLRRNEVVVEGGRLSFLLFPDPPQMNAGHLRDHHGEVRDGTVYIISGDL